MKMAQEQWFWILRLIISSAWILQEGVSYRSDFLAARQGCIWSTVQNNGVGVAGRNKSTVLAGSSSSSVSSSPGFMLDCNVRTLNVDFWNYTFNREQLLETRSVRVKCNEKLFFESFLTQNQTLFRLVNLKEVNIQSCKIRKLPTRVWASLGFLNTLVIRTQNGEWSSSLGLEIEAGGFEGLSQLETLDLSQNNIWSIGDKNIFCPLKSLKRLNMSRNRLSDLDELSFSSSDPFSPQTDNYCPLNIQSIDLSSNFLRKVTNSAFSRVKLLIELKLQNNLLEELEDSGFSSLAQLKSLNLSSNRLVALPPSIFRYNPQMREIHLSNNSISALSPQVFSGLENLLLLDLSRNTLSSQWVREKMFHGLHRLILLKLSYNQLSYIDPTIFTDLISLQALHLDNNRLETINPEAFTSLSNLHILDLSNNRLTFIDSRIFSNLFVLRQLYLDHNKIRKVDDDSLKNSTSLQDLGLADNLLQEVPVALRTGLNHLVTLDIGENRITSVSNETFAGLGQLYGLRMVDNRLVELPRGFCEPLGKLRVLNLAQNRISRISSTSFSACPDLRALRLDTNALEELPSTLAPQLPSLLWLNVSENRLRWADYHILPPTIEWLDLSYNALESLGGPSDGKNTLPFHLRVLDASHNLLTTLDYTTIPPALETLRVNHNRLKTVSPDTFIRSTRLRRVELMWNQLENLALSAIRFPPVAPEKSLPEFYLGGNPFVCDCSMEWLTRVNQLAILRQHPRIVDLDAIVCHPTFPQDNQLMIPLVETRAKDFLCPYKSHCFTLCHCCEFDACDCEMTCPANCTCYHDTAWSSNIVQCSNLQFSEIPTRIPMDATELYLDGNSLPVLSSHVFIGKKNLRVLHLNDSRIEFIRNKTFNGLKSLEVLRLDTNLLTQLHSYEFADLENLRELYLQNNQLSFISPESFLQLKFLQVLRLDGNLLVDFNVWELSGNGYLNSVMLSGNPWSCQCEFLVQFRTWVSSKTTIVVDFSDTKCLTRNNSQDDDDDDHESGNATPAHFPIMSMCNNNGNSNGNINSDASFQLNVSPVEDDITNHISAMGGPEKIAVTHPGAEIQIEYVPLENSQSGVYWVLILTISLLLILIVILVLIFRKEIYYWCYTKVVDENFRDNNLFCCGTSVSPGARKKSSGYSDDNDKLFDAYFLYSHKDEDILHQKIAPELEHSHTNPNFRLCLHYRDLCLNSDNPFNTEMILGACDASKRLVLILSKSFLQSELAVVNFRASLLSALHRHEKKLIVILLPPFTEQNLPTIYPELKNILANSKSSSLEWTDKNFWSKLKLILPSPSTPLNPHNGINAGNGNFNINSSAAAAMELTGQQQSYTLNRHELPYNSHHHYTRNIIPYQIPMTGSLSSGNTLAHHGGAGGVPAIPKHHIALNSNNGPPLWHQNQYNNSQTTHNNFPNAAVHPIPPQHFNFNESFRRHQHLIHHQHPNPAQQPLLHPLSFSHSRDHSHQSTSTNNNSNAYRPLDQNYSSSAISSSNEELDHVYSTLDSPNSVSLMNNSSSMCLNNINKPSGTPCTNSVHDTNSSGRSMDANDVTTNANISNRNNNLSSSNKPSNTKSASPIVVINPNTQQENHLNGNSSNSSQCQSKNIEGLNVNNTNASPGNGRMYFV